MEKKISSKKYALEVLQPDEQGFVPACRIESDEPFLAIHRGDTLNPSTWNLYCFDSVEGEYAESAYGTVLQVTGIEHSLVQREDGSIRQHKITVFTIPVENNHTVLFAGSALESAGALARSPD
jgi:hypothetical protein